ncbi:MAG: AhpC/TSA family protein [Bacteroidetes bacterium]|nr:AhpC/TSA family protein [Bacteroidota bacterium]
MKNLLIILAGVLVISSGCTGNYHTVSGKLENAPSDSYILLDELKKDAIVTIDSFKLSQDGEFKFRRKAGSPVFYLLKATNTSFLTVLIDPGEHLKITAHYDSLNRPAEASGAAGTELLIRYNTELLAAVGRLEELQNIYMANVENPGLDTILQDLDSRAMTIISDMEAYTRNYIDENPTSLATLLALYQQLTPGAPILHPSENFDYFLKVDSILFSLYPESEPVIYFHDQVAELKLMMSEQTEGGSQFTEGAVPPEIALPSPKGDTIKLSSTRGRVVLLDFWAAWCPPCRQESPYLVKAYDKYNAKGFEIYQVSLDKSRDEWLKGIEDDKLGRWIHVSDVMFWNSVVVPLYRIESIPFNLLLDREGKIIASNLRGEALLEVLENIMN